MSKVKKQHFVPQFYLRNFTDSAGYIYAFDVTTSNSFKTKTENIAHQNYFYDYSPLDELMGTEQTIEKALANSEAQSAKVLRKLVGCLEANSVSSLTAKDYEQLADHILTQQTRTPEYRIKAQHLALETERQLRHKGVSDEFIKSQGFEAEKIDPKFQQIYGLLNADVLCQIEQLCDRYWIFWRNKTKHSFYTSDHPVVGYLHEYPDLKAFEIYFPITPKFSVSILMKSQVHHMAAQHRMVNDVENPEDIKLWNSLMVTRCCRQVYSAENDFRLAKKIVRETPSLTRTNRERITRM